MKFGQNETWKKVYGPVFTYVNSLSDEEGDPLQLLWEDAKDQVYTSYLKRTHIYIFVSSHMNIYFCSKMEIEVQNWPYDFPQSEDFPWSDQRGNISGRLLVSDRYIPYFKL